MKMDHWEHELTRRGITFEYMAEIQRKDLVREQQTRLDLRGQALADEDRIQEIAIFIEDGGQVPPYMVERLPTGKLALLDGHTRDGAHELCGIPAHDAYLLSFVNSSARDEFLWTVNLWTNGSPPDKEYRMRRALEAINRQGRSVKSAARMFELGEYAVARVHRIDISRRRLASLGIQPEKFVTESHIDIIGAITQDPILKKMAEAAISTRAGIEELKVAVRTTKAASAKSEQAALQAIEDWRLKHMSVSPTLTRTERESRRATPRRPGMQLYHQFQWVMRSMEKVKSAALMPEEKKILLPETEDLERAVRAFKAFLAGPDRPASARPAPHNRRSAKRR